MSEAEQWRTFCAERGQSAGLVNDPFCRRLLGEVAENTITTGYCGRLWQFHDGSRLIATGEMVKVI